MASDVYFPLVNGARAQVARCGIVYVLGVRDDVAPPSEAAVWPEFRLPTRWRALMFRST